MSPARRARGRWRIARGRNFLQPRHPPDPLGQLLFCHGPDKRARKADRRLDTADGALAENEGVRAIVPGDLAKSDAVVRSESHDADEHMPPPKSDKKLTAEQIALVKKWIAQGAKYEPHWSFISPRRPAVPAIPNSASKIPSTLSSANGSSARV